MSYTDEQKKDIATQMDILLCHIEKTPQTRKELWDYMSKEVTVLNQHDLDVILATLEAGGVIESCYAVKKPKQGGV